MSNAFAKMKKKRNNVADLTAKLETAGGKKKDFGDDRMWYPAVEKSGNGYAVVRFLPPSEDNDVPFVKVFSHGFQGSGGWYIDECPTTVDQECPVCKMNQALVSTHGNWDSTPEKDKTIVRTRKRREGYVSNILIIEDPQNPENEGKIMLFKYGKKIFDKLIDALSPEFKDDEPLNPFDYWEGADFKIKIRKVEGYRNYDRSEFDTPSALFDGDDDKLSSLYDSQYDLREFVDPANFKPFAYYDAKLKKAMGLSVAPKPTVDSGNDSPFETDTTKPAAKAEESEGGSDDMLDYFSKLANE
jgi:hypothetical protein